ncbi:MAG TPA: phosphotransferase family protein [Burkholderiaceae bacterium]|jgi:aminoglycoside phosphotransferase (APT) family kinase protein|nr:phosphotransferase family protein [Burkholderiaceae bacterium]
MVARRLPGYDTAENLTRLSGGASQQTWAFEARGAAGAMPVILRRMPPESKLSETAIGLEVEAELIRRAARAGVPVPEVLAVAEPDDGIGRGFLMRRIEGETLGRRILRDAPFDAVRGELAAQAGRISAMVHSMPADGVRLMRRTPAEDLEQLHRRYSGTGAALPVFELAFRWLREHCPPPADLTLVHGDYRHGNLIIGPDGIRAVLDWELAHLGDPMEDLGWICVAAWRFGQIDKPVGGFGTREALFAAYSEQAGRAVDPQRVHFWEVMGTLRWGVMCLDLASSYPQFRQTDPGRAVERAMIGRRVSETDIDLLRLLAPRRSAR